MIPVSEPNLSEVERNYVLEAFDSQRISGHGGFIERSEQALAKILGEDVQVVVVNNGTSALHISLMALGIGPGDEVIVPSFTYIASVNAVLYVGAEPVFVDSNPNDLQLNVESVAAAVTARTRAIIAVHVYGRAVDMYRLESLASSHGIPIVEDTAEALGGSLRETALGTFGTISTFSFFANKLVTAGEGGAVVTRDVRLANLLRQIRNQGMDTERRFWFPIVGHNFRMPQLCAAILFGQLERFEELLIKRREGFEIFTKYFSSANGFRIPETREGAEISPWLFSVNVLAGEPRRDDLMRFLGARGVETRPYFIPVHTMPPYKNYRTSPIFDGTLLGEISGSGLNLPTSSSLRATEAKQVLSIVEEWVDSKKS